MVLHFDDGSYRSDADDRFSVCMARRRATVVDLDRARDIRHRNRNRLGDLTQYLPLVKRIASLARFSPHCGLDRDDAVQEGFIGLIDAAEKYDRDDVTFEAYASFRILGQILDAARQSAWKKRTDKTDQVRSFAEMDFMREEVSDVSEIADTARSLRRILAGDMSQREKQIFYMLFQKGLTLRECGERLGVTESRICQLRDKLIKRLRRRV